MVCAECSSHRICGKRSNNSSLYKPCKDKSSVKKLHEKKALENAVQRISPSSKTVWSRHQKSEIKVKSKNLNIQRRSKAQTIKRLKDKISLYKMEVAMDEELLTHMNEALNYAQANPSVIRNDIESTLLDILKEEAARDGTNPEEVLLTHEDTNKLVQYIADSMKNHIHKVNENKNRYRFLPYVTGLAMNQFLLSGKSKYDQNQDDNVIVMPSSGKLMEKKQAQGIVVGDCIVMYEKQLLIHKWKEEIGELMCDEMKLQEDILFNIFSNKNGWFL